MRIRPKKKWNDPRWLICPNCWNWFLRDRVREGSCECGYPLDVAV